MEYLRILCTYGFSLIGWRRIRVYFALSMIEMNDDSHGRLKKLTKIKKRSSRITLLNNSKFFEKEKQDYDRF